MGLSKSSIHTTYFNYELLASGGLLIGWPLTSPSGLFRHFPGCLTSGSLRLYPPRLPCPGAQGYHSRPGLMRCSRNQLLCFQRGGAEADHCLEGVECGVCWSDARVLIYRYQFGFCHPVTAYGACSIECHVPGRGAL